MPAKIFPLLADCPMCHGTGRDQQRLCSDCGGTGRSYCWQQKYFYWHRQFGLIAIAWRQTQVMMTVSIDVALYLLHYWTGVGCSFV